MAMISVCSIQLEHADRLRALDPDFFDALDKHFELMTMKRHSAVPVTKERLREVYLPPIGLKRIWDKGYAAQFDPVIDAKLEEVITRSAYVYHKDYASLLYGGGVIPSGVALLAFNHDYGSLPMVSSSNAEYKRRGNHIADLLKCIPHGVIGDNISEDSYSPETISLLTHFKLADRFVDVLAVNRSNNMIGLKAEPFKSPYEVPLSSIPLAVKRQAQSLEA